MTIETWLDSHPDQPAVCDIITINKGSFGPKGHRVRLVMIATGVLIEAGGETRFLGQ